MTDGTDRNESITEIKSALKRRSGKTWSVTGGKGTSWGWITIDAPPSKRTWIYVPKQHNIVTQAPGAENWDEVDTGKPGGHTGPTERAELASLLGLESVHHQGVGIAASCAYHREYIERANGQTPSVIAEPYWD